MLTHEQCVQLRDAGFPQPEPRMGQHWYSPKGFCWISGGYKRDVIYCDIALPYTPSLFLERVFDKTWIYCPTVEDMLSLLKREVSLKRLPNDLGWCLHKTHYLDAIGVRETPMETLFSGFILCRSLFEDTAGSAKG